MSVNRRCIAGLAGVAIFAAPASAVADEIAPEIFTVANEITAQMHPDHPCNGQWTVTFGPNISAGYAPVYDPAKRCVIEFDPARLDPNQPAHVRCTLVVHEQEHWWQHFTTGVAHSADPNDLMHPVVPSYWQPCLDRFPAYVPPATDTYEPAGLGATIKRGPTYEELLAADARKDARDRCWLAKSYARDAAKRARRLAKARPARRAARRAARKAEQAARACSRAERLSR